MQMAMTARSIAVTIKRPPIISSFPERQTNSYQLVDCGLVSEKVWTSQICNAKRSAKAYHTTDEFQFAANCVDEFPYILTAIRLLKLGRIRGRCEWAITHRQAVFLQHLLWIWVSQALSSHLHSLWCFGASLRW